MIFLDIKQYCNNNCRMFEADIEREEKTVTSTSRPAKTEVDTIIRCKNRDICERMRIEFGHPNEEDFK